MLRPICAMGLHFLDRGKPRGRVREGDACYLPAVILAVVRSLPEARPAGKPARMQTQAFGTPSGLSRGLLATVSRVSGRLMTPANGAREPERTNLYFGPTQGAAPSSVVSTPGSCC